MSLQGTKRPHIGLFACITDIFPCGRHAIACNDTVKLPADEYISHPSTAIKYQLTNFPVISTVRAKGLI